MAEKRSLCECSSTPEASYFTSKGQSHVHCPCEKCEDRAVYPMVAWRHMQKRVRYSDVNADDAEVDTSATALEPSTNKGIYIATSSETTTSSDCLSVSHYYAEFDYSSSSLLQADGGARDDDETVTDESGLSDIDSSHSGDVLSEGSEGESDTFSDEADEQANGMRDFITEAVLRLVEIKGTVGFSISTFW